jgi:thiamine-phosphate pyrophosphorylase
MKPSLTKARVYGILDLNYVDVLDIANVTKAMIQGGVDLIQLRGKQKSTKELASVAAEAHDITSRSSVPLIINDHAGIAVEVPVEGVHVGQDDDPIATAREKAGRELLVGKSTHSLEQANAAEREGADYIGFGPIFATPTKPDYAPIGLADIKQVHREVSIPIFCIGGINIDNLQQVIDAGAKRVVMVSALLSADNIVDYARRAVDRLA